MIKYGDLVQYIKENHVNWNTDLFDVLRGFFEQYSQQLPLPSNPPTYQSPTFPPLEELMFQHKEFKEPENGEYTNEDLINLFST